MTDATRRLNLSCSGRESGRTSDCVRCRPDRHKPRAAARKNFSQRKKNNGRAATGIDHNVRARIAHLAYKSENDLKQVAAD